MSSCLPSRLFSPALRIGLAVCLFWPAAAAWAQSVPESGKTLSAPAKPAVRSIVATPGRKGQIPQVRQAAPAALAVDEDPLGRTVFQVLLGEFSMRSGDVGLAADLWADLAVRTNAPDAYARAVEILGAAKRYEEALMLADQWLTLQPDSARAKQLHSSLLVLANRLDDLAPQISELLVSEAAALPANLMQLNRLLARHNDKRAVFRLVDRVTQPYLSIPEAQFARAQAAANAENWGAACQASEELLRMRPDWEVAMLLHAQILRRFSVEEALAFLAQVLETYPQASEARLLFAHFLTGVRRVHEARIQADRLLAENQDQPEVLYSASILILQQGDLAGAERGLLRVLALNPPNLAPVYFFLGQIAQERQAHEQAVTYYLQVTPGEHFLPARTRAAGLLLKSGRGEEGLKWIREAAAKASADPIHWILAEAQILRDLNRLQDSAALLERALVKSPDQPDLLYEAALAADRLNQLPLMERHLRHLLSLQPKHAHALNALGYSLADRKIRLPEAEALIRQALSLMPDDPFIQDSLGWLYFRQGRMVDALEVLKKAYAQKPDAEIAQHVVAVLQAMGKPAALRAFLEQAVQAHPEQESFRQLWQRLQP